MVRSFDGLCALVAATLLLSSGCDTTDTPAECVETCEWLSDYYFHDQDRDCFVTALTNNGYDLSTSSCGSLITTWEETGEVSIDQCEACMDSLEDDARPCVIIFSACMGNGD